MHWQKLGLLWAPTGELAWSKTHATLPVVHAAAPRQWQVYLSTRDAQGKSRIGRLYVDATGPPKAIRFDPEPVLSLGEPGTFDDSGVMPGWLVTNGDELRLYYIGWNVIATVPYRLSIGLAVSRDGGRSFHRYSQGPVVDRSSREPFFATAPCVHKEGNLWRLWYVAGTGWQQINDRWEPGYHVKYAESADGIDWTVTGVTCIQAAEGEAIGRPCVFRRSAGYAMHYSYRRLVDYRTDPGQSYRLGYAESDDGIHWRRLDDRAGIDVSPTGWDSQMQEYCWVQREGDATYLLYNGNTFGHSGVGVAKLVEQEGRD